jgi:Disintegrin
MFNREHLYAIIFSFSLALPLLDTLVGSLMLSSTSGNVNTSCLVDPNPNRLTISLQMCGNGIVESGEDCDPGIGVNSTCCDSKTCKFTNNAVCDPSSAPCCTAQCQFAPASQVCRPAKDPQCDTPEVCTGNSSACPADLFAPNGKSCGPNGLACATGECTSLARGSIHIFFSKLLTELTACRLTITSTMPTVGSIDESAGRVPETE